MSDTSAPVEETKIPVTSTEETKIPVTSNEEKKTASPKTQNEEDNSIPVTIHTEEKQQKKPKQPTKKEKAETIKQQANKEFGAKRFAAAIQLYNQALELDPTNHILYSNRAAARYNLAQEIASKVDHPDAKDHCSIHSESTQLGASMSLYYGGLEDALKAIEIEPNFLKAYLRVGACLTALGKYQAAVQTYEATLTRFPNEESVKTALKEAREKATKLEEGFPLYHSFISLAGQPSARASEPAKPSQSTDTAAAATAAARLHRELFGKRNALVQTPKPETRWKFYYEPPNPRSTASWKEPQRHQYESADAEEDYQEDDEEEQQYYQSPPSQTQSRYPQQQPRYQQAQFYPQSPSQTQYHRPQRAKSQQPSYQQPPHQSSYQQYQQPAYQQYQQPAYQHQQPSYQSHQPRKRSDNTSIPNRKAVNGYLQELCDNLRVSQYLPALIEQGVETVDDLLLLPPESIVSIFPTLGHQARVFDWLKKAKGEL